MYNPKEAFKLIKAVWKYLAATPSYHLEYGAVNYD